MQMPRAKQLCPDLLVLPYSFDRICSASRSFFCILCKFSREVQPMSCDEAFLSLRCADPMSVVSALREEVFRATGCTVSAGVGPNMLLAKVATRKAKPNGQFWVSEEVAQCYLDSLPVGELPGIGYKAESVLASVGISTVAELRSASLTSLKVCALCPPRSHAHPSPFVDCSLGFLLAKRKRCGERAEDLMTVNLTQ